MKNLFNFKWLLLSFVLSIASINQLWADEGNFFDVTIIYVYDGNEHEYTFHDTDNSSTFNIPLGTITSDFYIKKVWLKCWDDWGAYHKWDRGQIAYTFNNLTNKYYYGNGYLSTSDRYGDNNKSYNLYNEDAQWYFKRLTDGSGNYTMLYYFHTWNNGTSGKDDYVNNSGNNYKFTFTIAPPDVDSIYVTSNALAGDGSYANPYIVAYGEDLQIDISSASKARTDANSSAQYSVDNTNWGTATSNTRKTISNVTNTSVQNWMVYARFHNSTAPLTGEQKGRYVYYRAENRYNITATASPAAGGTVTPTSTTIAGQNSGGDITATPFAGYRFNGWSIASGSGYFGSTGTSTTSTTANTKFRPSEASTLQASFIRTYAYIEGRFKILDVTRAVETTTYGSGNWDNNATTIQMDYEPDNKRFVLHTYMTPYELSQNMGTDTQLTPYFYIKLSTSSSSLSEAWAYRPATNVEANQKLTTAGTDGQQDIMSQPEEYSFWFDSDDESGYVVLYCDETHIWYELEPATFTAATDADWDDATNWTPQAVPTSDVDVVISAPVEVNIAHAKAKSIVIDQSGDNTSKLTVLANNGLEVEETIKLKNAAGNLVATTTSDIVLESDNTGNATLIFDNSNSDKATVLMYSKGWTTGEEGGGTWNWQYVGVPVTDATRLNDYYDGYMYEWNTSSKSWDDVTNTTATLDPFKAYSVTYPTTSDKLHTYVIDGTLVSTTNKTIDVAAGQTVQAAANSWTAPIRINNITSTNWSPASIFLFNTGYSASGAGKAGSRFAAGTYLCIPIGSAPYLGEDYIAPMQGFLFKNTKSASAGTITFNYSSAVRTDGSDAIVAGPMHAPQHYAEAEPDVLKIYVSGTENDDRVVLLAREGFSRGFDNAWDGEKFQVNAVKTAPRIFAINETGGKEAVSAIPEMDGTVIGFRPGTDEAYKITFEYNGFETLVLRDTKTGIETYISDLSEYEFTSDGENEDSRFLIRKIYNTPTGVEGTGADSHVRKQMIDGTLYIIRDGRLYDVTGTLVK